MECGVSFPTSNERTEALREMERLLVASVSTPNGEIDAVSVLIGICICPGPESGTHEPDAFDEEGKGSRKINRLVKRAVWP